MTLPNPAAGRLHAALVGMGSAWHYTVLWSSASFPRWSYAPFSLRRTSRKFRNSSAPPRKVLFQNQTVAGCSAAAAGIAKPVHMLVSDAVS